LPTGDNMRAALLHPDFTQCAAAGLAIDITSTAGKENIIELGFNSQCTVIVRALRFGEGRLAARHDMLQSCIDARIALGSYYGYCLTVDPVTKSVPDRAKNFSMARAQGLKTTLLDAWLKVHLVGPDWYNSPGGVFDTLSKTQGGHYSKLDPTDFYCVPAAVKLLCKYLHILFVASGHPSVLPPGVEGFTMLTWCDFYLEGLDGCLVLDSLEAQYKWLQEFGEDFVLFLKYIEDNLPTLLKHAKPAEQVLGALAPLDVAPAENIRERLRQKAEYIKNRDQWGWAGQGQAAKPLDPGRLPRLSERKKRNADSVTPRSIEATKKTRSTTVAKAADGSIQPGSATTLAKWLTPKSHKDAQLLVSGWVWPTRELAVHFKVDHDGTCWEVVLCRRQLAAAMALCPSHGQPHHKGGDATAHALHARIIGQQDELRRKFGRKPTPEESRQIFAAVPTSSRGRADGRGGGDGRKNARGGGGGKGGNRGRATGGRSSFRQPSGK
jgi:hypothetical protein